MCVPGIKILSIQYPERYAVRRLVILAQQELKQEYPDLELAITEINDPGIIGQYACVIVLPTLVIDEKVVCSGCFPSRDEVIAWLRQAIEKGRGGQPITT